MAIWDDLVAYYKCADGNDSWGEYEVSLTDVELSEGIGPTFSSWDFAASGSSDKAVVLEANAIPANTGILSVSMWFKGLRTGNGSAFTSGSPTSNNTIIRIASDELGIRVTSATSCGYNVTPIRGLSTWTHLAVTADGAGNYEFYIDGSNVGSISGGPVFVNDVKRIGNLNGSDDEFADYITEIAFWSRVLTSDEVELIYSNGATGTRDLTRLVPYTRKQLPDNKAADGWFNMSGNVLLYHLDDASGGSETDGSGNGNTGAVTSVSNVDGIYMHSASYLTSSTGNAFADAASFNGSTSIVNTNVGCADLGVGGANARTFMAWGKVDTEKNYNVLWHAGNTSNGQQFAMYLRTGNGVQLNGWGGGANDLFYDMDDASDPYDSSDWNHYVGTYDGTNLRLFVNAIERGSSTPTLSTGNNDISLGDDIGGFGDPLDGQIQEFAIFDEALPAADLLTIYNQQKGWISGSYSATSGSAAAAVVFGTAVHEGGTQAAVDNVFATAVHEGGTQAAVDNVFATVVHTTSSYLTIPNITGTVAETASFGTAGSYGIDYYEWSWNFVPGTGSGVVTGSIAFPDNGGTTPINMTNNTGLYHCDGASIASAGSDSSGQGNTVSFSNVTFNSDPYIGSGSWGFDGATSYVTSDGTLDGSGDWTVSLWFYDLSSTSTWRAGIWSSVGDKYPIMVEAPERG